MAALFESMYCRPRALLALGFAITALAAWAAFPIPVGNDLESLLLGHPSYSSYQEFLSRFGNDETVAVVHPAGTLVELFDLTAALGELPFAKRVSSLIDLLPEEARRSRAALQEWSKRPRSIDRLREALERTRLARDRLATRDLGTFAVIVRLDLPAGGGPAAEKSRREAHARLAATLDAHFGRRPYHFIGYLVVEERVLELVRRSNGVLLPLGILVGAAVLAALFRSAALVAVALLSVLSSLVWTAACFRLGDYTLNAFSTMLFPLLLTVGLTTTIYVMSAYLRHPGGSHSLVLGEVIPPTVACTITTFVGFLSLAWTDTEEVRKFGIYDALGTVLCLVSVLLHVPPLMALLRPRTEPAEPRRPGRLTVLLVLIVRRVGARPWRTLALFAALGMVAAAGIARLPVESSSIRGLFPGDPVVQAKRAFERAFGPLTTVELVARLPGERSFLTLEGFRSLRRLQAAVERVPGVACSASPADVLLDAASFIAKAAKDDLPTGRELDLTARLCERDGLLAAYLAADGRLARVRVQVDREGSLELLALSDELKRVAAASLPAGSSVEATGRNLLSAIVHRSTMANELSSFALALSAILAVMALSFRSLGIAAIAAVPNLLPLALTYGAMGWLGAPLDVVTGMIPCVLIGLVVDDTIHYFYRYREHRARGIGAPLAARLTTMQTGRAMVTSALALAAGVSVMAFSEFRMTMQFGLFTALAVLAGIAVELTLTPALLVLLPKWK